MRLYLDDDSVHALWVQLLRMLAKDPALRYATPGEAARELRPFLTGWP